MPDSASLTTKAQDSKAAAKQLADATRTPTEKLHAELERLQKLHDEGHINEDLLARGRDAAAKQFDGTKNNDTKQNPISAIMAGSQEAQQAIVRAMTGGSNPNKVLEDEARKNSQGQKEIIKYLAQLAGSDKEPTTIVDI